MHLGASFQKSSLSKYRNEGVCAKFGSDCRICDPFFKKHKGSKTVSYSEYLLSYSLMGILRQYENSMGGKSVFCPAVVERRDNLLFWSNRKFLGEFCSLCKIYIVSA